MDQTPHEHQNRHHMALLIAVLLFYPRFGSSIVINPATHQPDFRPLIILTIVSSLVVIGLWVYLKAIWFYAPQLMEKHIVRWMVNVITAIVAYWVLVSAQTNADDFIRSVIHITPASLPEAQRTLTLWFAVAGWFTVLFIAAYIVVLSNFVVQGVRPRSGTFGLKEGEQITNAIVGIVPIFVSLLSFFPAITALGPSMTIFKMGLIIDSSFTKNEPEGTAKLRVNPGDALICRNLPMDAQLAFVTDEAVPSKVLVLETNESAIRRPDLSLSSLFEYFSHITINFRLTRCENTSDPESLSGGGNHPSVHRQEK